jgi:hypothetical protein
MPPNFVANERRIVDDDSFSILNPINYLLIVSSLFMSNFSLQVETGFIYLIGCIAQLLRNTLVQSLWPTSQIKEWSVAVPYDFCKM